MKTTIHFAGIDQESNKRIWGYLSVEVPVVIADRYEFNIDQYYTFRASVSTGRVYFHPVRTKSDFKVQRKYQEQQDLRPTIQNQFEQYCVVKKLSNELI